MTENRKTGFPDMKKLPRLRIGCSIHMKLFDREISGNEKVLCEAFGGRDEMFRSLSGRIDTVEMHSVYDSDSPERIYEVAEYLHAFGIGVTAHARITETDTPETFFAPYGKLFESGLQSCYTLTLHPLNSPEETVRVLAPICRYAEKNSLPVCLTLENQRMIGKKINVARCETVLAMIREIGSPLLGTTLDFGHRYSNQQKLGEDIDPITDEFYALARQTHIHSYCEGTTHFPLTLGEHAIHKNVRKLIENGYTGVLNLELDLGRFAGKADFKEALLDSIDILKKIETHVQMYLAADAFYKNDYLRTISAGYEAYEKEDCAILPLRPALYYVKLGGKRILVDPARYKGSFSEETISYLSGIFSKADIVIFTHKHGDHYDPELLSRYGDTVPEILIPEDFAKDASERSGYPMEKFRTVKNGDVLSFDGVKITFFESAHVALPELGFLLQYGEKTILFPTDIRSYEEVIPKLPQTTDATLVAHVWLGRGAAGNPVKYGAFLEPYRAFITNVKPARILWGHLYDTGRTVGDAWTGVHAEEIEKGLSGIPSEELLPGTVTKL